MSRNLKYAIGCVRMGCLVVLMGLVGGFLYPRQLWGFWVQIVAGGIGLLAVGLGLSWRERRK